MASTRERKVSTAQKETKAAKKAEADAKKAEVEARKAMKKAEAEAKRVAKKAEADAKKAEVGLKTVKKASKKVEAAEKKVKVAKNAVASPEKKERKPRAPKATKAVFMTRKMEHIEPSDVKSSDMYINGQQVKAIVGKAKDIAKKKFDEITKIFSSVLYSPRKDMFVLIARTKTSQPKFYDIIGIEFIVDHQTGAMTFSETAPIYASNVSISHLSKAGKLDVEGVLTVARKDQKDMIKLFA